MKKIENITHTVDIVNAEFLDSRAMYMTLYNRYPNIHMIRAIDATKAVEQLMTDFSAQIVQQYRHQEYNHKHKKFAQTVTLLVMDNGCILEFGHAYCEVLHNGQAAAFIDSVTAFVLKFKEKRIRTQPEINLLMRNRNGLYLKSMEIKRTKLDIGMYYEDDFAPIDQLIQQRLSRKKDKGVVLLHGVPGTGKTTYLRYLIGRLKKQVLFISPDMANDIMSPDFIELLMGYPDSILVIEDAEHVIMDRKAGKNAAVSHLLNLSDGLLADCLNIQLVCSFNSHLSAVDSALLRKGRLIASYEFKRLPVPKAQVLSDSLGYQSVIQQPLTLAEIVNQHESTFEKETAQIGFRAGLQAC